MDILQLLDEAIKADTRSSNILCGPQYVSKISHGGDGGPKKKVGGIKIKMGGVALGGALASAAPSSTSSLLLLPEIRRRFSLQEGEGALVTLRADCLRLCTALREKYVDSSRYDAKSKKEEGPEPRWDAGPGFERELLRIERYLDRFLNPISSPSNPRGLLLHVLDGLLQAEESKIFQDHAVKSATGYLKKVQQPMCLYSMYANLRHNENLEELEAIFLSQLELIHSNCCTFNGKESSFSRDALKLRDVAKKKLRRLPSPKEAATDYQLHSEADSLLHEVWSTPTSSGMYPEGPILLGGQNQEEEEEGVVNPKSERGNANSGGDGSKKVGASKNKSSGRSTPVDPAAAMPTASAALAAPERVGVTTKIKLFGKTAPDPPPKVEQEERVTVIPQAKPRRSEVGTKRVDLKNLIDDESDNEAPPTKTRRTETKGKVSALPPKPKRGRQPKAETSPPGPTKVPKKPTRKMPKQPILASSSSDSSSSSSVGDSSSKFSDNGNSSEGETSSEEDSLPKTRSGNHKPAASHVPPVSAQRVPATTANSRGGGASGIPMDEAGRRQFANEYEDELNDLLARMERDERRWQKEGRDQQNHHRHEVINPEHRREAQGYLDELAELEKKMKQLSLVIGMKSTAGNKRW